MEIDHLIKTMQASIAPCLLISGFGFLLLTMTNRLARASDRLRIVHHELKKSSQKDFSLLKEHLLIFYKRCRLLKTAIAMITFSIFFVSVVVLLIFSTLILDLKIRILIEIIFATSIICLIVSLFFFLLDIRLTLDSIKIEIEEYLH